MNGKERIDRIFSGSGADRAGFWAGHPVDETMERYMKYFNVTTRDEFSLLLQSDAVWVPAEWEAWKHPENKPLWDTRRGLPVKALDQAGVFGNCEDSRDVEKYEWPDPAYLDFTSVIQKMDQAFARGQGFFGGPWTYIFQLTADFLGMENFFVKMYTDPLVVEAIIERIVDFYLQANKKYFEAAGERKGIFFFANDLGSQEDLLMSPEMYERFLLPGFKKIIQQAKDYHFKVMFHSCGAISKIIPSLIDAGIDALHPLQANAKGMNAEFLAKEYGKDLVFVGGVDTQVLLPCGTPREVKNEVRRLKKVFGPRYIVSPSHEGVLPNIPPENMIAMRDAAVEV